MEHQPPIFTPASSLNLPYVLFNINGVLNTEDYLKKSPVSPYDWNEFRAEYLFDPALVQKLNPLVDKVQFVCTSRWELRFDLRGIEVAMQRAGFTGTLSGTTPKAMSSYQCNEIGWWLGTKGVKNIYDPRSLNYVVLDCFDVSYPGRNPFPQVLVSGETGLTEKDVELASTMLDRWVGRE